MKDPNKVTEALKVAKVAEKLTLDYDKLSNEQLKAMAIQAKATMKARGVAIGKAQSEAVQVARNAMTADIKLALASYGAKLVAINAKRISIVVTAAETVVNFGKGTGTSAGTSHPFNSESYNLGVAVLKAHKMPVPSKELPCETLYPGRRFAEVWLTAATPAELAALDKLLAKHGVPSYASYKWVAQPS